MRSGFKDFPTPKGTPSSNKLLVPVPGTKRRRFEENIHSTPRRPPPSRICAQGTNSDHANIASIASQSAESVSTFSLYLAGVHPSVSDERVLDMIRSNLGDNEIKIRKLVPRVTEAVNPDPVERLILEPVTSNFNTQPIRTELRSISLYYQNAGGMRTKTTAFYNALSASDHDCILISETWLNDKFQNCELSSNYSIYRCDRSAETSTAQRGGGVLIAVKKELNAIPITLEGCEHLEQTIVRIRTDPGYLYLCCIYLRPNSCLRNYETHFAAVQRIMNLATALDSVIVVGDYNLPQLQWIFDHDLNSYLPTNASTEAEISLTEMLFSAGLHQICSIPNNNMRLLDLAFCNDPGNVIMFESPVSIIPTDRHHKPYVLCVEVHSNSSPTDCTGRFDFVLDYSKCNFDLIAAAFDSTNWEFIGANDNVNVAVDAFYRKLHSVLKQYVPLKSSPRPQSFKHAWWNSDLRRLRNQLRKARKCYTKNRTEDQRRRLRSLERDFKELNDNLYRQHISRLQQNLKRDPSSFWKHFKSKRRHATIPVDISFNGVAARSFRKIIDSRPI
ncbi:uncharacterized protein LOC129743084 [Uranotaenia lowii]|uniref:uncharacterized protein LOC129743084 n=1 Tax=Uranotaenia lowii TaxID=190385 RepID=UPI002478AE25|nr:uncharacterized protein LOC129743084 [Uranotaenia lowii]